MRTIRKTTFMAVLVMLAVAGLANSSKAQYGTNNAAVQDLVRSIQTHTATLRNRVQNASDRGSYRAGDLIQLIADFDSATTQLQRRASTRRTTSADAQLVLDRGALIDNFFANNRLGNAAQSEWGLVRSDLSELARIYNLSWQSNASGPITSSGGYNSYNLTDPQMRQLIQSIDTRSVTFSRNLRQDLSRRNVNDRYSADEVLQQLSAYESALVQLRNRVNSRQSTASDVQNVLRSAAFLNRYLTNQQLSYQTESSWNVLKPDLDRVASAYNIAWNWSTVPVPGGGYGTNGELTGTYRLNTSQGDDPRLAAQNATRGLPSTDRQQVYDSLIRRFDPPQMLAIDRRGTTVTIASTRAPQINFLADGRENVETTPNGRSLRVRAQLSGDTLSITRSGDRTQDFTVTFDPIENGRRLLVTRTLYSDRLTQPVTLRAYYDRVSDVAQLNLYETNREDGNIGNTGTVNATFVVPNGTQLVGVLNGDLSTQNVQVNDRFTMTVRSPSQFEGATIEGYVSSVSRGGRVTGRSEMTLSFDTIRLRDGRSYPFAGILENVRTPNGDVVRIDNEGAVRESDQTNKTVTRTAVGTAVGAIIGAIAGGGKGAAIGAVIGAGAGAGSVYVQGRNDLELTAGTEVTVRATGTRY
jgi:YMGG-like Gly-zipper